MYSHAHLMGLVGQRSPAARRLTLCSVLPVWFVCRFSIVSTYILHKLNRCQVRFRRSVTGATFGNFRLTSIWWVHTIAMTTCVLEILLVLYSSIGTMSSCVFADRNGIPAQLDIHDGRLASQCPATTFEDCVPPMMRREFESQLRCESTEGLR